MTSSDPLESLARQWPTSALKATHKGETIWSYGDQSERFALASLTKPLFASAVLIAIEEGALSLDDETPVEDASLRHLLSHASGVSPDNEAVLAVPGTRRIYSNYGFELISDLVSNATGFPADDYLTEAVLVPLEMTQTEMAGSAAHSAVSSVDDMSRWLQEVCSPTLMHRDSINEATSVQFEGISGALPGFGSQDPNPWGLGFEIRGAKSPHWTGQTNSEATYGHFGRSGTFFWVDPERDVILVGLGSVAFDSWAVTLWPAISDAVLELVP